MDGKAGCPRVRALTRRGGALDRSITAGHLPTSLWLRFGGFGERDIIMTLRNILLGATMLCAATTPAYAFAQDAAAPADTGTAIDDSDYGNDIIEIGRASCRERVYQSVETSVVAVTFKK